MAYQLCSCIARPLGPVAQGSSLGSAREGGFRATAKFPAMFHGSSTGRLSFAVQPNCPNSTAQLGRPTLCSRLANSRGHAQCSGSPFTAPCF